MQIHNLEQGSSEWLELRASHFTASEAPAMMGVSKYASRSDLLKQKKTGITPEVSEFTQKLFDQGHATEAAARLLLEEDLGEDLFPLVCSEGKLLASVDGSDMDQEILFEHKLWNEELAASVNAGNVPESHLYQLEQQLWITGARCVIFVVSDGTRENWAQCEYVSNPAEREKLLAGWNQFEKDLEAYEPEPETVEAVGVEPDAMPSLSLNLVGEVRSSNLPAFKAKALEYVEAINTDLQTDEDFATAELDVKFCRQAEKDLDDVKAGAIKQTASIDEHFRVMDSLKSALRDKRLALEKLVKARKEAIRIEIAKAAESEIRERIASANKSAGNNADISELVSFDFYGAMKGKRSIKGCREAVSNELAKAKIVASAAALMVFANSEIFETLTDDATAPLFPDISSLILKQTDDFTATVKLRIAEDKARQEQAIENAKKQAEAVAKREAEAAERSDKAEPAVEIRTEPATIGSIAPKETPAAKAKTLVELVCREWRVSPSGARMIIKTAAQEIESNAA